MKTATHSHRENVLRLRRLGIDTYQEPVIYMPENCAVCRSEGFEAQSRIQVEANGRSVIATLNVVRSDLLNPGEAGLSEAAWKILEPQEGDLATLSPSSPLESLSGVRSKIYGHRLEEGSLKAIITDIVSGHYSDVHLSAFISACGGDRLNLDEIVGLTRAMVEAGERLEWGRSPIMDKHCIGGLPGNRTTPIVVSIVTALGLTMPKTSSRAITSPAGTADMMETLAPVELDVPAIRRVVEKEGGCIVWGGNVRLSPADDILIRVERALDLDSEGQLVASVLSKKIAAGATHVLIDLPTGRTAKLRSREAAEKLSSLLHEVGKRFEIEVKPFITVGAEPIGRGIGPALEARDVLDVLKGDANQPFDLRERALFLAARLLEISGQFNSGEAFAHAKDCLVQGKAWKKFQAICEAQGGMREPPRGIYQWEAPAPQKGDVTAIDNRRLARVAKLAGAPKARAAGIELKAKIGSKVEQGDPLFILHAETPGELEYARNYLKTQPDIFRLEGEPWGK